ncbi:PrsW family intramembrane metalloprotease [Nocardioidaceae bacterium]|nr:PrsW family intramembrane metalloprotease [Nocardioidaceae bacterium]
MAARPAVRPAALPPEPGRVRTTLFTVLVTVALLVGGLITALVLLSIGASDALVVAVVLAALPVGPVLALYLWLDRYEPEPRSLLLLGLGWGALVATSAAIVFQAFDQVLVGRPEADSATLVAPVVEEAAKGAFVGLVVWLRRKDLDGVLDGLVYAGFVGIGFAFTENVLYLSAAYLGEDGGGGGLGSAVGLFVLRGLISPFAHPLFTSFIGIGLGLAVTSRSGLVRILAPLVGYVLAVVTHMMWNSSALYGGAAGFLGTYVVVMLPAFAVLVVLAVWARRRERRMLERSLTDAADRGLLDPREVPWLVNLDGRKAMRTHARRVGGRRARDATEHYQQLAVRLGFLHHRMIRGNPPEDGRERGARLLAQMQQVRPAVRFPGDDRAVSGGGW